MNKDKRNKRAKEKKKEIGLGRVGREKDTFTISKFIRKTCKRAGPSSRVAIEDWAHMGKAMDHEKDT